MKARLLILLVVIPIVAEAQLTSVAVIPPQPTDANVILLDISLFGCGFDVVIQRTGTSIRVDLDAIGFVCGLFIARRQTSLGTLPEGTYTYQIFVNGSLDRTGTFSVVPAPEASTLSPGALAALAAVLGLTGYFIASRR